MNNELANEIASLGGTIEDEVWYWFVNRGPHGEKFTWSQTNTQPAGYVSVERLPLVLNEKQSEHLHFKERAFEIAKSALHSNHDLFLIKAIQLCAVLGTLDEAKIIKELINHPSSIVSKHAKAASFYLKKRL